MRAGRKLIGTLAAGIGLAVLAPASAQAGFGVSVFEAGTCYVSSCTYASVEANHGEAFTQAAGHPPWGGTAFELNHTSGLKEEPEGAIKRVRVDVPPGLAANPEALPQCSKSDFEKDACPASAEVGNDELTVSVGGLRVGPITGQVYNLEPGNGLPLLFGIHVEVPLVANEHIYLEGHVDWAGDFHEYFEINNISKAIPVIKSKLNFHGVAGKGDFLTLPSVCSSTTVSHIEVESWEGAIDRAETHTPVGVEGCGNVPFQPEVVTTPETARSDQPDGATIAVEAPQHEAEGDINTADIKDVELKLPEGMTLNPPAAGPLGVCTAVQFASECPASSKVGSVDVETDLPPHSLTGAVYLGSPTGATITGPPFTLYLFAQAPQYGVQVRLQGQVQPDPATGRLTTTFRNNPQLPFSELALKLNGGNAAPVANPLACGTGRTETTFVSYLTNPTKTWLSATPFATGGCPSPLPFALAQSTQDGPVGAGAFASYTFNLERGDGQQYLQRVTTTLPAGLVGLIPSVPLCGEPQAASGSCGAGSQIGTATALVGAGGAPLSFTGPVYLTGGYAGGAYGLSIPIEAAAGRFDLGRVVTRAAISVDPTTARVIVAASLPTIVKGVPLRLRAIHVNVNRASFLLNPTNCGPLSTDSTLLSTFSASDPVSSPFQVSNCGALAFKPAFAAATDKKTVSRAGGASLSVTLAQPAHEANIKSIVAQLPLQLPSRLSTLQKACLAATYAANPRGCPAESLVGTATASTPVLPQPLSGPAYLVSHGGAAFPDLDLLLEGDGVRVILVGNTNIRNGITTSTFASIPDVPVSSFALNLPVGPHSALAANGNLCSKALTMPTTITAQSGTVVKQNTRIAVNGCGVSILRRKRVGRYLLLTIRTFAPGRVVVSGNGVQKLSRRLPKPTTTTLKLRLTTKAVRALRRRHHRVKLSVSVLFLPISHGEASVRKSTTMTLRH